MSFLGAELGGRGTGPSVRDQHGRVLYERIAQTDLFRDGLRRVWDGSKRMSIAMMCTEGDPLNCHRAILVSRCLVKQGAQVTHIYPNGRLESHQDAEDRLLRITGLYQPEMFRTESEMLDEAYGRQEDRIAYVAPSSDVQESISS